MANDFHGDGRNPLYEHDRIALFAPNFNNLRRMLIADFPKLWKVVGGMMYHNHEMFIEYMNSACDTNFSMQHNSVDECCTAWLKKLEELRAASQQMIKLPSGSDPLFNLYEDACAKQAWDAEQKRKR